MQFVLSNLDYPRINIVLSRLECLSTGNAIHICETPSQPFDAFMDLPVGVLQYWRPEWLIVTC
jgi:hypothetical protein